MRSWPIRRKLFVIPLLAALLLVAGTLSMLESAQRYERSVRAALSDTFLEQAPASVGGRAAFMAAQAAAARALDEADRSFLYERIALAAALGVAVLALLVAAWQRGQGLSRRIGTLRLRLSHLLDRSAAPIPEDPGVGDEIEILSNRLHKAIIRGRERETQLRRSSEFLEFAQEAGGFGIFDLDLVTGQVTGTPLFFDLLGLANYTALFTRDDWLATVHPEDLETVIQKLNHAIATGGSLQAEYRTLRLDSGSSLTYRSPSGF